MNVAERMLAAMTGPDYGIRAAYLGFMATYTYTRSHDGAVINDEGDTLSFGRWYSFKCAAQIAWERLWLRP